jgi:hypothetical protein
MIHVKETGKARFQIRDVDSVEVYDDKNNIIIQINNNLVSHRYEIYTPIKVFDISYKDVED